MADILTLCAKSLVRFYVISGYLDDGKKMGLIGW